MKNRIGIIVLAITALGACTKENPRLSEALTRSVHNEHQLAIDGWERVCSHTDITLGYFHSQGYKVQFGTEVVNAVKTTSSFGMSGGCNYSLSNYRVTKNTAGWHVFTDGDEMHEPYSDVIVQHLLADGHEAQKAAHACALWMVR